MPIKAYCKYIRYLSIGQYVGVTQTSAEVLASRQTAQSIQNAKAKQVSPSAQAVALGNQTGGNILGFTYE